MIDLTPLMVLIASSILSVTSMSMISGLAPGSLVVMLTMGKSTRGSRSTPMSG
ncbi:secreted protein [Candidatus Magnetobacterium bavaricum]|uniref:Secreted protein n=1 Tax=Candidatus Magnetobacterium bavaricum TaxID=29290 RepID=A0A0F3GP54_9BACT|nr:secreted protein [Candidatus Magnetobacterium bavaricum]